MLTRVVEIDSTNCKWRKRTIIIVIDHYIAIANWHYCNVRVTLIEFGVSSECTTHVSRVRLSFLKLLVSRRGSLDWWCQKRDNIRRKFLQNLADCRNKKIYPNTWIKSSTHLYKINMYKKYEKYNTIVLITIASTLSTFFKCVIHFNILSIFYGYLLIVRAREKCSDYLTDLFDRLWVQTCHLISTYFARIFSVRCIASDVVNQDGRGERVGASTSRNVFNNRDPRLKKGDLFLLFTRYV